MLQNTQGYRLRYPCVVGTVGCRYAHEVCGAPQAAAKGCLLSPLPVCVKGRWKPPVFRKAVYRVLQSHASAAAASRAAPSARQPSSTWKRGLWFPSGHASACVLKNQNVPGRSRR